MKRHALAVAVLLAASAANAQIYQWKDENGKTVISDKPPTGNAQLQKTTPGEAAERPAQKSLAERDLEYRKRQKESRDQADKKQQEETMARRSKEACEQNRRYLKTLESGERVVQRDDKGERIFLEDAQREQEMSKTRQLIQETCK